MSLQTNPNKIIKGTLSGTPGNTQAIIYTKFFDVEAASVFDYAIITTGFTVSISVSTSDTSNPDSMVWNTPSALTSIVGTTNGTRDRYSLGSFTAVKIDRLAGAGVYELVISTNGAAASGGTTSNPSVVQGASASGATASGNPVSISGVAHTTPRVFAAGQTAVAGTNLAGDIEFTQATRMAGENLDTNRMMVEEVNAFWVRITTAATTNAKGGSGCLTRLVVEAALTGTVTFYDNIAGSGTVLLILPIGFAAGVYPVMIPFGTGLTAVTSEADRLCLGGR